MSVDNFDSLHFQRINSYVEIEYRDRLATRTVCFLVKYVDRLALELSLELALSATRVFLINALTKIVADYPVYFKD